jgi:hypothetical protein
VPFKFSSLNNIELQIEQTKPQGAIALISARCSPGYRQRLTNALSISERAKECRQAQACYKKPADFFEVGQVAGRYGIGIPGCTAGAGSIFRSHVGLPLLRNLKPLFCDARRQVRITQIGEMAIIFENHAIGSSPCHLRALRPRTDRAGIRRRSRSPAAGAHSATRPHRTAGYSRSWLVRP